MKECGKRKRVRKSEEGGVMVVKWGKGGKVKGEKDGGGGERNDVKRERDKCDRRWGGGEKKGKVVKRGWEECNEGKRKREGEGGREMVNGSEELVKGKEREKKMKGGKG